MKCVFLLTGPKKSQHKLAATGWALSSLYSLSGYLACCAVLWRIVPWLWANWPRQASCMAGMAGFFGTTQFIGTIDATGMANMTDCIIRAL